MYRLYSINDTIRVPPNKLGSNLKETVLKLVQEEYEGVLDHDLGIVVAVTKYRKLLRELSLTSPNLAHL